MRNYDVPSCRAKRGPREQSRKKNSVDPLRKLVASSGLPLLHLDVPETLLKLLSAPAPGGRLKSNGRSQPVRHC